MPTIVKLENGGFINLDHVVRLSFPTIKGDDLIELYFSDGRTTSYFGDDRNRIIFVLDQMATLASDDRRSALQKSKIDQKTS